MTGRVCPRCGEVKPTHLFPRGEWNSWCNSCRREADRLQREHDDARKPKNPV